MDYIIEYKANNNPNMPVVRTTFTTCKKFDVCSVARCFEKSQDNRVFVTDCKKNNILFGNRQKIRNTLDSKGKQTRAK